MQLEMCCNDSYELVKNSGKKGFSLIPKNSDDLLYFCFQSRIADHKEIEYLEKNITTDVSIKMSLIIQRGIKFCPFCGTDLKKVIKKNRTALKAYAKDIEKFVL